MNIKIPPHQREPRMRLGYTRSHLRMKSRRRVKYALIGVVTAMAGAIVLIILR